MAKFYGEVGYGISHPDPNTKGVWIDQIVEFAYFGDVLDNSRKLEQTQHANPNIIVSNSISIIANEYAIEHFMHIKYVRWAGVLWTVSTVKVQSPRLILSLGDVYNGPTPTTP